MLTSLPNGATVEPWTSPSASPSSSARPEPEIALDEAALLVAAHAHPDLDVDARLAQLDALAARAAGVSRRRAVDAAVRGRGLPRQRRPTTATPRTRSSTTCSTAGSASRSRSACVMIEVGRRCGLAAARRRACPGTSSWVAARASGSTRSTTAPASTSPACAALFAQHHADARFRPQFLMPVGPAAILQRMLANLQHSLPATRPEGGRVGGRACACACPASR